MTTNLYTADNLDWLRSLESESVKLCYMDPPYNTNKNATNLVDGGVVHKAVYDDVWTWTPSDELAMAKLPEQHGETGQRVASLVQTTFYGSSSDASHLLYLGQRVLEARRVLRPDGFLVVQIDDNMLGPVDMLLRVVFGKKGHCSTVTWQRTPHQKASNLTAPGRISDYLLFYSKTGAPMNTKTERPADKAAAYNRKDARGAWRTTNIVASAANATSHRFPIEVEGVEFTPPNGWRLPKAKIQSLADAGELTFTSTGSVVRKLYLEDTPYWLQNIWEDVPGTTAKTNVYPTQKPVPLLERVVRMTTEPGDLVIDPYLGSGTTGVAAIGLGRRFAGCDCGPLAVMTAQGRIEALGEDVVASVPSKPYEVLTAMENVLRSEDASDSQFGYTYQWMVVRQLTPHLPVDQKWGKDGGQDHVYFSAGVRVVVSVKSGKPKATDIRDLAGVVAKYALDGTPTVGCLVLGPKKGEGFLDWHVPTADTVKFCNEGGVVGTAPRLQVLTGKQVFDGVVPQV